MADLASVRGSGTEVGPSGVVGGSSWRAWVEGRSVYGSAGTASEAQVFAGRALTALRAGRDAEDVFDELRSTDPTDRSAAGAAGWGSDA